MVEMRKTDVFPRINEIKEKKQSVFIGFRECPYCVRAEEILQLKNVMYEYVLRDEQPELEKEIKKSYGHKTYPMIFVDGEFVGGCSELMKKYNC